MCRSRRELSNAYLFAKFGFDTAENEPCQVCPIEQGKPGGRDFLALALAVTRAVRADRPLEGPPLRRLPGRAALERERHLGCVFRILTTRGGFVEKF